MLVSILATESNACVIGTLLLLPGIPGCTAGAALTRRRTQYFFGEENAVY